VFRHYEAMDDSADRLTICREENGGWITQQRLNGTITTQNQTRAKVITLQVKNKAINHGCLIIIVDKPRTRMTVITEAEAAIVHKQSCTNKNEQAILNKGLGETRSRTMALSVITTTNPDKGEW
jgi:hypothetical protein